MFGIGASELLIILVIILIIFGVGKLPQVGEGLGKAIRGFKKGISSPEELDETSKREIGKAKNDHEKSE
jgi:sec-independent protein translocase protein TatA